MCLSQTNVPSNLELTSQVLIHAETRYLVGKYKILTSQVTRHPYQRLISDDWVDSLHKHFVETGIDRAAHPIKAVLGSTSTLSRGSQPYDVASSGDVPWLPANITVSVYHGQHRIEACKKLENPKEHWWFAEVYGQELEINHPAEFLALMHTSNEDQYRLTATDYDRFTVLHRLNTLHSQGKINSDVFATNCERVARSVTKEGTRHGLLSLSRSQELFDSVARALRFPNLRPAFNAGTWGKKLTKGRFYQLAGCLVDEMVEQCRLLQDDWPEVSPRPFQLAAQSCTWKTLESAVKKKGHPWAELPGGAVSALARVSKRPEEFLTLINPRSSDGWTFPQTVLLPSVLTSEIVGNSLTDMYEIAQHLIHMIAGGEYLERYTTTSPRIATDNHPTGIISHVLKSKLGGKPSNYPDKIVHFMWTHRSNLLQHLTNAYVNQPSLATVEQYESLIGQSEDWWSLLRMLKLPALDQGLGLVIPRSFNQLESQLRARTNFQAASIRRPPGTPLDHPSTGGGTSARVSSSHNSGAATLQGQDVSPSTTSVAQRKKSTSNPGRTSKRKRTFDSGENRDDQDYQEDEEARDVHPHQNKGGQRMLRCHDDAARHLRQLEQSVSQMRPDEASALDKLVQSLAGLQGTGYMARVLEGLVRESQMLTSRARRASEAVEEFEREEPLEAHTDRSDTDEIEIE